MIINIALLIFIFFTEKLKSLRVMIHSFANIYGKMLKFYYHLILI